MKNVRKIIIPVQTWKPKCPSLPILKSYAEDPPADYWLHWSHNSPQNLSGRKSWISSSRLTDLCNMLDYHRPLELRWAVQTLVHGACIGATGRGRIPFSAENYPTARSEGHLLADSMNDWLSKNLAVGPYDEENLPFKQVRVNPMSVQPKPNGSGRIVMDFSAPHLSLEEIANGGNTAISLNASIDKSKYRSSGVATIDVLKQLQYWGPGCYFSKLDWQVK